MSVIDEFDYINGKYEIVENVFIKSCEIVELKKVDIKIKNIR